MGREAGCGTVELLRAGAKGRGRESAANSVKRERATKSWEHRCENRAAREPRLLPHRGDG